MARNVYYSYDFETHLSLASCILSVPIHVSPCTAADLQLSFSCTLTRFRPRNDLEIGLESLCLLSNETEWERHCGFVAIKILFPKTKKSKNLENELLTCFRSYQFKEFAFLRLVTRTELETEKMISRYCQLMILGFGFWFCLDVYKAVHANSGLFTLKPARLTQYRIISKAKLCPEKSIWISLSSKTLKFSRLAWKSTQGDSWQESWSRTKDTFVLRPTRTVWTMVHGPSGPLISASKV